MTGIATKPAIGTALSVYRYPLWVAVLATLMSAYLATALAFSVLLFTGHFGDPAAWCGFALIGSVPYLIFAMGTGTAAVLLMTLLRLFAAGDRRMSIVSGAAFASVSAVAGGYTFVVYSQDPDGLTAKVIYASFVFGVITALASAWVAFSTKTSHTDEAGDAGRRGP